MAVSVAVVGLGYVGIPVAARLASTGIEVIGIDIDSDKVSSLNSSKYPLKGNEPGIQDLIEQIISTGKLRATTEFSEASDVDVWIICVQTPLFAGSKTPNLGTLEKALTSIGKNLKKNSVVIIESTIPPGTTENFAVPILEQNSDLVAGEDFGIGHCPERVMPGKLLYNLSNYGRVLGAINQETSSAMLDIYSRITKGDLHLVDVKTAEVVKTFENTYRDVEIAIANDFAKYCDSVGVDFFEIRDQVNKVESRNLHLPGGGVGGHCIPKDTWLLAYGSRDKYEPNFLTMARAVNDSMPEYVYQLCIKHLNQISLPIEDSVISILGLSYLEESDDARNSPSADLYSLLNEVASEVRIHDHYVDDFPGIDHYKDLEKTVQGSDILVIMVAHELYRSIDLDGIKNKLSNQIIVDARNVLSKKAMIRHGYDFSIIGRGSYFNSG